jgi:hypothetical protein
LKFAFRTIRLLLIFGLVDTRIEYVPSVFPRGLHSVKFLTAYTLIVCFRDSTKPVLAVSPSNILGYVILALGNIIDPDTTYTHIALAFLNPSPS